MNSEVILSETTMHKLLKVTGVWEDHDYDRVINKMCDYCLHDKLEVKANTPEFNNQVQDLGNMILKVATDINKLQRGML